MATVIFVSFSLVRENLRGLREFLFYKIRTQVGLDRPQIQTYRDLLTKLPAGSQVLENCYDSVEKTIKDVKAYVDEWLRYQALWDLQPDSLNNKFGEDISKWMKLLTDIKKSRATFDTSDTKKGNTYPPIYVKLSRPSMKKGKLVNLDNIFYFIHM